MNLAGKHILILGLGESGLAAALWGMRHGGRVRGADTRVAPPYLAELQRRATNTNWHVGNESEFIAG